MHSRNIENNHDQNSSFITYEETKSNPLLLQKTHDQSNRLLPTKRDIDSKS